MYIIFCHITSNNWHGFIGFLVLMGMFIFAYAEITCTPMPAVVNATKDSNLTIYVYNDVITYTCIVGHQLTSGNISRTCTGLETWSGTTPVCSCTCIICVI